MCVSRRFGGPPWGARQRGMSSRINLRHLLSAKSSAPRAALRDLPTRRVGLVLGAGGATGMAFHAGTLLAVSNDFGWDPQESAVVVGTSAGSVVGMLLRSGFSTDDLAAWGSSVAAAPGREPLREVLDAA